MMSSWPALIVIQTMTMRSELLKRLRLVLLSVAQSYTTEE